MMRISKLTDYGILLMTHFARAEAAASCNARDLAKAARVPLPTVSKLLKVLSRAELLVSQRGVNGGYRLARPAEQISLAQIIGAIEGPIGLTECARDPGCQLERLCPTRDHWARIAETIRGALEDLRLSEMAGPPLGLVQLAARQSKAELAAANAAAAPQGAT